MFRRNFLAILLLLTATFTKAQIIYEHSDTALFRFAYVPYERSTNNKILNQLALAHLKVPEKTNFQYSFRYRVSVNYNQNDSLSILFDVKTLEIKGDKQIKDFDLQKLLEPSEYNISITLQDHHSDTILYRTKDVIVDHGMGVIAMFPDSLWREGLIIDLKVNDINFTEDDYSKLQLELNAVRDYYASGSLKDTLLTRIQKVRKRPTTSGDIFETYITGVKGIGLLNQSLDNSSEIVPGKDPLKLVIGNKILKYNMDEYITFISGSKIKLLTGNSYHEFAKAYLQSLNTSNKLSQSVDYYSSPFFYKLYSNSITASQLLQSGRLLARETNKRGIKDFNLRLLTREIMKCYLTESNRLLKEERYLEAADLLAGATKFKNLTPYDQLSIETENELAIARKGLIYSFTQIIQKSLDKNLFSLAEKYLAEVENYLSRFEIMNNETSPFKEVYLRMADIQVQFGQNALAKHDYSSSLYNFNKALEFVNGFQSALKTRAEDGQLIAVRSIYNGLINNVQNSIKEQNYLKASDEIKNAEQFAEEYKGFYPDKVLVHQLKATIAEIKYKELINGLSLITESRLQNLIEAQQLFETYNFAQSLGLDSLIFTTGMPYLDNLFSKGRSEYWASEPDSALIIANEAYAIAAKLKLDRNPKITEQYNKLVELAGETYCTRAKGEYNSLINQANDFFTANKFEQALQKTDQARELLYAKASCGIPSLPLNRLLSDYQSRIKWYNLVTQANTLMSEENYQEAAELIQQAESLYTYYHLDQSGIANVGYYDLALKSDNTSMIKHAVSFLITRGKPDQAMSLLEKLRLNGIPAIESEDMQESLARNLATRDKNETPDLNIKVMIDSYTKGELWYSKFETTYRYYARPENESQFNKSIDNISNGLRNLF